MSKETDSSANSLDRTCSTHDTLVNSFIRFEDKLDDLKEWSSQINTKLAEFLARHDEQEKRFYILDKKVVEEAKSSAENKTSVTILIENHKSMLKDLNELGRMVKNVDNKCDSNKTLMYTGTIAGLSSLLLLLGNFLFTLSK